MHGIGHVMSIFAIHQLFHWPKLALRPPAEAGTAVEARERPEKLIRGAAAAAAAGMLPDEEP